MTLTSEGLIEPAPHQAYSSPSCLQSLLTYSCCQLWKL